MGIVFIFSISLATFIRYFVSLYLEEELCNMVGSITVLVLLVGFFAGSNMCLNTYDGPGPSFSNVALTEIISLS